VYWASCVGVTDHAGDVPDSPLFPRARVHAPRASCAVQPLLRDTRRMAADPDLIDRVRRARRALAEMGPVMVRAEGDFDRVAVPSDVCDSLRDIVVAEKARVVI
jgi:hypothetical protein